MSGASTRDGGPSHAYAPVKLTGSHLPTCVRNGGLMERRPKLQGKQLFNVVVRRHVGKRRRSRLRGLLGQELSARQRLVTTWRDQRDQRGERIHEPETDRCATAQRKRCRIHAD